MTPEGISKLGAISCVILRGLVGAGWAARLLGPASVLTRRDPRMTPESMSEMTLVVVPDRQRRIDNTHAGLQELSGPFYPNALEAGMRRQTIDLRERTRKVE